MPRGFDFQGAIATIPDEQPAELTVELDEQGLQVAAVTRGGDALVVTTREVPICSPFPPHEPGLGSCGAHFVGLNARSTLRLEHGRRHRPELYERVGLAGAAARAGRDGGGLDAQTGAARMAETTIQIAVRFRLCRQDDLEALEWMGLHTREREIIAGAFAQQQSGEGLMLLADAGGFPVAQAWLDFAGRGSADCPHLWAVRVFPPLQGAGLGERLMAEAEALAARRSARQVELEVEPDNPAARRFYWRLGYRPVAPPPRRDGGERPRDGEVPQEIMRKTLRPPQAAHARHAAEHGRGGD